MPRPAKPMTVRKNEAGTTGILIFMGDLQPVFLKLEERKRPQPTRHSCSRLLPSACRGPCWGDGAVLVCSFCLGVACHLFQYCSRTVYDEKPSPGQNHSVLEHKAASTR